MKLEIFLNQISQLFGKVVKLVVLWEFLLLTSAMLNFPNQSENSCKILNFLSLRTVTKGRNFSFIFMAVEDESRMTLFYLFFRMV